MNQIETNPNQPFTNILESASRASSSELLLDNTLANFTTPEDEPSGLITEAMLEMMGKWEWKGESNYNPELGISINHAFFGDHHKGAEEIYQAARRAVALSSKQPLEEIDILDITDSTGFDELYQLTPGLTEKQYGFIQEIVARELTRGALERQKLEVQDVDLFIVATSIPLNQEFAKNIAKACNIPPETEIITVLMACNSTGWARAQVESGKFDKQIAKRVPNIKQGGEANIMVCAIDDQHKYLDQGGDSSSPQVFSSGAAAMVWSYGPQSENASFRQITHISQAKAKGMEDLTLYQPQLNWLNKSELIEEEDNYHTPDYIYTSKYLTSTEDKQLVYMKDKVGIHFSRGAFEIVKETINKYQEQGYKVSDIKKVIAHHPSRGIFNRLGRQMAKLGFTEDQLEWVITEGNVPVLTMPVALGRQLDDLNPGDKVMFLTFGAGGGYTCSIDEVGPGKTI